MTTDLKKYMFTQILILIPTVFLFSSMSIADSNNQADEEEEKEVMFEPSGAYELTSNPSRPRNYILPPLFSFFLPGLDQWIEGQYTYAGIYSGTAVAGYAYAAHNNSLYMKSNPKGDNNTNSTSSNDDDQSIASEREVLVRKQMFGLLAAQGAGGISAYHSFRSTVPGRQKQGQFTFLKHEETPLDVMIAPFRFGYLKRLTTLIPLGIAAGLYGLQTSQTSTSDYTVTKHTLHGSDYFFASAFSYNAGTHEEALFRGWVMPVIMEWSGNRWVANIGSSALFALAHIGSVSVPLPQFLLGMHMAYVSQSNEWTLGESIFIHTWWDVIVFLASYQVEVTKNQNSWMAKSFNSRPTLHLPPIQWVF